MGSRGFPDRASQTPHSPRTSRQPSLCSGGMKLLTLPKAVLHSSYDLLKSRTACSSWENGLITTAQQGMSTLELPRQRCALEVYQLERVALLGIHRYKPKVSTHLLAVTRGYCPTFTCQY